MSAGADVRSLDKLVTEVATALMSADTASMVDTCDLVLQRLVAYFGVDMTYVRRNDHEIHATVLVAEWPRRAVVPDPDPLGVVYFAGADPVFAALENLKEVLIVRPDAPDVPESDYQERVHDGSGIMGVSLVTIPMLKLGVTTGAIGLIQFGDRRWSPEEINTLTALAALLAEALSRVVAEQKLRYLAYHDELTGLYNRRALHDHLADRLLPGRPTPMAVLFIDLDRLKAMNDFLGHSAGDQFLQEVSRRLSDRFGPDDFVARLSGDELIVVLGSPSTIRAALGVAADVQVALSAPVRVGDDEVSRTVSVGVALARAGCTGSELLTEAGQAVIAAKAQGGNGIVAYNDQMRARDVQRTDVELHLRDAIRNGELVLYYQPQVDLITGDLLGAEALVRWNHPTRGLLQPGSFVGIAEATNLSGELGRWVMRAACAQFSAWQQEVDLADFCLGINVSPAQLITVDLVGDVARALRASAMPARNLVVEITESAVVADLVRARETLDALTDLGVHLAIDDFGTGYSSLAQLKTLPVHTLKIDCGFVTTIAENPNDRAIVRSIIDLATAFGLKTMAEGVETPSAVTELIELGCHQAQGYLISRPVPARQLLPLLHRGRVSPALLTSPGPPGPQE